MRQKRRRTRRSISPCVIMAEDSALRQHDKAMKTGPQGNGPAPRVIDRTIDRFGDSRHQGKKTGAAEFGKRRV